MKDISLGILRHLLTTGGGALASKGLVGTSDVELLTGSILALVGIGFSVYGKMKK